MSSYTTERLNKIIRQLTAAGYTQTALSEKIGVSKYDMQNATRGTSIKKIIAITDALELHYAPQLAKIEVEGEGSISLERIMLERMDTLIEKINKMSAEIQELKAVRG